MVCIYCANTTQIKNSRHQIKSNSVWRRRKCLACESIFTSIESVDLTRSLVVIKNNVISPFSRDKLLMSVHNSLKHRKTAQKDASALTDTIISKLYTLIVNASLNHTDIIDVTASTFRNFDKPAEVHYLAFHKSSTK